MGRGRYGPGLAACDSPRCVGCGPPIAAALSVPQVARYKGRGSTDDAASFECRVPEIGDKDALRQPAGIPGIGRSRGRDWTGRRASGGTGAGGPAAAGAPGDRAQPGHARAGRADHRRLDLPREPESLRDAAVRRGVRREATRCSRATGDPGRWRSPTASCASSAPGVPSTGSRASTSIVPYPACVGRLDRGLPGWTRRELDDSLALVRTLMVPNWDIHPEMVTHTRVIDLATGHPYPDQSIEVHGELGVDDRAVGRRARRVSRLRAAHPERGRPAVRRGHHARRALARRCCRNWPWRPARPSATSSRRRSRTTSATRSSAGRRASRRASRTRAASTGPIRNASSASSPAPTTGRAAGTTRRPEGPIRSSRPISSRAAWSK